tara:strand:+ start:858 stop:1499 length:642 start_codon:yes stop_codon:yes gene_type:complete
MTSNKVIYGLYDDDDKIVNATKTLVDKGYSINEVYSPFPVHGLDTAMGLKYSRMAITSFFYGVLGAFLITLLMWYIMVDDWPMIIGGKPNFTYGQNLPAFIPVTFEATVFFAAHLMVITFLFRCGLYPGRGVFAGSNKYNPDPRTTDDKFLMEICEENPKKIQKIEALMRETGAIEIQIGEYKVKKRRKEITIKDYLKNNLNGFFRVFKRKKK